MAYLPHAPLFLLIILMVPPNLSQSQRYFRDQFGLAMEESSRKQVTTQEALDYAVSKYNEISSDSTLSRVVGVLSVRKRHWKGTIYNFEVILGQTICMKDQSDLTNCPLFEQAAQQERKACFFVVHVEPNESQPSVKALSCGRLYASA